MGHVHHILLGNIVYVVLTEVEGVTSHNIAFRIVANSRGRPPVLSAITIFTIVSRGVVETRLRCHVPDF